MLNFIDKRKLITLVMFVVFTISSSVFVFATAGSFSSTYDMTGGLYSRDIANVGDNAVFTVSVTPTLGLNGSYIDLTLQKAVF